MICHRYRLCYAFTCPEKLPRARPPGLLWYPNLITKEDLSGVTFPTPVATGGDHIAACIIDVQLGDSSSPMTRNN